MNKLGIAAREFADSFKLTQLYSAEDFKTAFIECFEAGAEWEAKQSPIKCLKSDQKICDLCHKCDIDILNPTY